MQAPLQARNDSDAAQTDNARTVAQKWVRAGNRPDAMQRQPTEMVNNSPRVLQQRALSDAIHNSPRMVVQRHKMNALFGGAVKPQGRGAMPAEASPAQREEKTNNTGLPNRLKSGIESLSGMSMDHVTVHYNSDKPAQLQAHAYAQGNEIHLGAGQEGHLPHEAWHIVQQAQGRVQPTLQMKAGAVNDDPSLEKEADIMGEKAAQFEGDSVVRNRVADERVAGVATQRVAGFARSGEFTPQFVNNRPESPLQMKLQGVANQFVTNRTATGLRQSLYKAACNGTGIVQRSIASRMSWRAYVSGLPNNQVTCDAIDTREARTTLQEVRNGHGDFTNRIIRLHTWAHYAWGEIGSVTIDRSPMGAMQGPLLQGAAAVPGPGYDDRELTLHTAAAGGAGNAGVATHLFPAVLGWINSRLRGVQQINMNPAGGAASKSVIADLGARLGNGADHANANTAREARKTAAAAAAAAAAGAGPAVVAIGSGAGAGALNTWDTRLNEEHTYDLASLNAAPLAGLSVSADGMTLAGPAAQADIPAMRAQRDFFRNTMNGADPVINAQHPNAAYFQAAAALTDAAIDAEPRTAARMLRMARLTSRSGVLGTGGGLDAGYQITLGGAALARLMPRATGN